MNEVLSTLVYLDPTTMLCPGCMVGTKPFYYKESNEPLKPVVIGKRTIIHSGTNINLGVFSPTTIGDDCRIDSLCHIAHDCNIGDNTIVAAGTILGGFVKIGKNCRIGLNVTVKNRVEIADNSIIGMGAVITHNVSGRVVTKPNTHMGAVVKRDAE